MEKIFDLVSKVLAKICFVLILVYTVLVAVQVISRYVFNSPTTWTELAARYLFVWSITLYMSVLYKQHGNAAFDLVFKRLKGTTQSYVRLLINVIICVTGFYLTYWGTLFCMQMKTKKIVGLGINVQLPMNIVYAAIPVGSFFLLLMCINEIYLSIGIICRKGTSC